jgi:hypothetical protein
MIIPLTRLFSDVWKFRSIRYKNVFIEVNHRIIITGISILLT